MRRASNGRERLLPMMSCATARRNDRNTLAIREISENIKNNFNGNFPVKTTKVIFRLFNEIKQVTSFDFVQYGVVKVYDNNLCRRRRKCDWKFVWRELLGHVTVCGWQRVRCQKHAVL